MRFLLFNVIVIGALAYLFTAAPDKVRSLVDGTGRPVAAAISAPVPGTAAAEKPAAAPAGRTPAPRSAETETPAATALAVEPAPRPAPATVPAPAPAPGPRTVSTAEPVPWNDLPAIEVPVRATRTPRDIPITDAVAARPVPPVPPATKERGAEAQPRFMTAEERGRELYRLAREMEAMFADKATR